MGIQQSVGDLRAFFQAAADRGLDSLTGLAAKARQIINMHRNAAHAAHFVAPRSNMQANAELLVQARPGSVFDSGALRIPVSATSAASVHSSDSRAR